MTTYKSYAECKIANPDGEIVTTGKNWKWAKHSIGTFLACNSGIKRSDNQDRWVICNPADHCSSIKEFLEAGFKFAIGDLFLGTDGTVHDVGEIYPQTNQCEDSDNKRYILSAAALNGGCKIPAKADQWTVYNNTLPLCELTDEQYGKMRRMHDAGAVVEFANVTNEFKFEVIEKPNWCKDQVYRIKPKSERELFIDKSVGLMTSETERTMEQMFGAQFDAGARYKDTTKHFGESI